MTILDCRPPAPAQRVKKHKVLADKKAVVAKLAVIENPGDRHAEISRISRSLGINKATIYRWVGQARSGGLSKPPSTPIDEDYLEEVLVCFYGHQGNAAETWRDLTKQGKWSLGLRSFQDFLLRSVDRLVRQSGRLDEQASRLLGIYVSYQVPHRDHEWQIDLVDLCVEVEVGEGERAHVWAAVAVDKRTGFARGWCLTLGTPTADAVIRALIMGIRPRTELLELENGEVVEVEVGGAPTILRCDNGLQLIADVVTLLMIECGTAVLAAAPYNHTAQGKIERWNGEAKKFSGELFGTTRGTKTIRDQEPFRGERPVMGVETIDRLFCEKVHRANRTAQRGQTLSPLALYASEDKDGQGYRGPVPDDSVLARFSLRQVPHPTNPAWKINRGCVRFRSRSWTAPQMANVRRDSVEIWESLVDDTYIEVRADGVAFQVFPNDALDPDLVEEILETRGEQVRRANKYRRAAAAAAAQQAEEAQQVTDAAADAASAQTTPPPDAPSSDSAAAGDAAAEEPSHPAESPPARSRNLKNILDSAHREDT